MPVHAAPAREEPTYDAPPIAGADSSGRRAGAPRPQRRRLEPSTIAASLLGRTIGARVVSALALLSSAVYLIASESLAYERRGAAYRGWLWREYLGHPAVRAFHPTVRLVGVLELALFVALCLVTAIAARRASGGAANDRGAQLLAWALASAVVPTLLLATIWWPDGRGHLTSGAILAANAVAALLAIAAALVRHRRLPDRVVAPSVGRRRIDRWLVLPVVCAGVLVVALVADALVAINGYDALSSHMPLATSWLRNGRLTTAPEQTLTFFFPGNSVLLTRWAIATGDDRLCFLGSLAAALLAVWLVYEIAREIGQRRVPAAISALAAASYPVVANLSTTAYTDLVAAMPLLLATLLVVRWHRRGARDRALAVCIGWSLGFAAGAKYSALPPIAAIGLFFLGALVWATAYDGEDGRWHVHRRWLIEQIALVVVPALLCCGYWYARNWAEHGNPLFPVSVLGLRGVPLQFYSAIPADLIDHPWRWLAYPWSEVGYQSEYQDGLGAAFAGAAVLGLLVTPWRRPRRRTRRHVVYAIAVASIAYWMFAVGDHPRYTLFGIVLAFVFVGELWMAFDSTVLRAVIVACIAGTMLVTARSLATRYVYWRLIGETRAGVPPALDTLSPGRVLNALGAQSTYRATGRDHRHLAIAPYDGAEPADLLRQRPDYLVVRAAELPAYAEVAELEIVARDSEPGRPPTILARVGPAR